MLLVPVSLLTFFFFLLANVLFGKRPAGLVVFEVVVVFGAWLVVLSAEGVEFYGWFLVSGK